MIPSFLALSLGAFVDLFTYDRITAELQEINRESVAYSLLEAEIVMAFIHPIVPIVNAESSFHHLSDEYRSLAEVVKLSFFGGSVP